MTIDATVLVVCALVYLGLLFLSAEATERGWIPARLARHPWVSALSLGVYASTWTYYGSVGYARSEGFRFLSIYFGVSLACLLVPVVWTRVLRLSHQHQLASLADLFAFRYGSPGAGVAVTLFQLAGSLPYLAQQIRAVSASIHVLTGRGSAALVGLVFTAVVAAFAVLFGVRHVTTREKHDGLVLAVAIESLVKLVALLSAGVFALFGVLGGPAGLSSWLAAHPEALEELYRPVREGPWGSLLLLSFAAAFLLPRQYHMAFTESRDARSLRTASWLFPLFLLLLNIAIPPILWAGTVLDPGGDPDLYLLRVATSARSAWLPIFVFVGGVSAASAMIIVTVLALSSMCLNHLVVPLVRPSEKDLYRFLRWSRRGIVLVLLLGSYGLYLGVAGSGQLVEMGLVAFVAVAQFLPGLVGVLFWRRAQARAVLGGLGAGIVCWTLFELLPLLVRSDLLPDLFDLPAQLGITGSDQLAFATFVSLAANSAITVWMSLAREPTSEEEALARSCIDAGGAVLLAGRIEARAPHDFARALVPTLGPDLAAREVARALADVGMPADEPRPAALRRLRDQLQRNLSGLLGPVAARDLFGQAQGAPPVGEQLRVLERELARSTGSHKSLSAELEQVRRYLRDVFQDLPVGACAVGPQEDVVLWNRAMVTITGIGDDQVAGAVLGQLPAPWGPIFAGFAHDPAAARPLTVPRSGGREGRFHLRKSHLSRPFGDAPDEGPAGLVILVEDLTERASLEAQLEHRERLALIGQLAASVAHEIGNPLAAISSVAQNLQRELADGDARRRVETIRDLSSRIAAIVKSLVVYSRAGAEAARAPASAFSLAEAVDEAVSLVRLAPRGQAQPIENDCPTELWLWGDRPRLVQVFINLLYNACDASPAGSAIRVRGRAEAGRAIVEIIDQGAGVPADLQGRIFEPFFTTKVAGKGTGLGLSLATSIVRDHDGTLDVASRPGAGTTVTLTLPRSAREAVP